MVLQRRRSQGRTVHVISQDMTYVVLELVTLIDKKSIRATPMGHVIRQDMTYVVLELVTLIDKKSIRATPMNGDSGTLQGVLGCFSTISD